MCIWHGRAFTGALYGPATQDDIEGGISGHIEVVSWLTHEVVSRTTMKLILRMTSCIVSPADLASRTHPRGNLQLHGAGLAPAARLGLHVEYQKQLVEFSVKM